MQRVGVGLGIDRDGLDAQPLAGADDAAGDLAAIGDQDLVEQRPVGCRLASRRLLRRCLGLPWPSWRRPWRPSSWRPCSRFLLYCGRTGPWPRRCARRSAAARRSAPTATTDSWRLTMKLTGDEHQQREQCRDHVLAHDPAAPHALLGRQMSRRPRHRGMLPCLRHGFSSFLVSSVASARQIRRRVPCGMITSSMKPRLAATNGLANFSRYSSVRAAIFVGVADVGAEDDLDRALGAHHRDLRAGPGIVHVAAQVLGRHHVVGAAIGLAGDHRHLRHRRLGIGVEQLGAVLDDAADIPASCPAGSPARRRR